MDLDREIQRIILREESKEPQKNAMILMFIG